MFGSLLTIDLEPRVHAVANDSTGKFPNEEAPWTGQRSGGGDGAMPMTAAPWAKKPHDDGSGGGSAGGGGGGGGGVGGAMPITAAPWAKKPRA